MPLTPQSTSLSWNGKRSIISFFDALGYGLVLAFTLSAGVVEAQKTGETPFGIAWEVRGLWQVEGGGVAIVSGDAIRPGSLLKPGGEGAEHSIVILLPDGQRILYECFQAADCARGFRVPSLYRQPDSAAVEIFGRVRAVLAQGNHELGLNVRQTSRLARDEALAVLGPGFQVEVKGLAATLANGRYTYDLRPWNPSYPRQSSLELQKTGPSITLSLPSTGLYNVTVADYLNTPRINLFVAAVSSERAASLMRSFHKTKSLLEGWNEDYQGWPIHDFQRAYLQSLLLSIKPWQMNGPGEKEEMAAPDVTSEPILSPKPGVFKGDTSVTLRCVTPGAIMHYTVDGSQPFTSSPVYGAPIMVKGTELTIKAYATAPGKKDSAVITGIFRIAGQNEEEMQRQ